MMIKVEPLWVFTNRMTPHLQPYTLSAAGLGAWGVGAGWRALARTVNWPVRLYLWVQNHNPPILSLRLSRHLIGWNPCKGRAQKDTSCSTCQEEAHSIGELWSEVVTEITPYYALSLLNPPQYHLAIVNQSQATINNQTQPRHDYRGTMSNSTSSLQCTKNKDSRGHLVTDFGSELAMHALKVHPISSHSYLRLGLIMSHEDRSARIEDRVSVTQEWELKK
ncbi:hypothetical protein QBC46DRAFT_448100 [Diplogelasinospora grovesii]|uniref:Uncharacterized protein n=1 Tax=Diplogelasinospora grovesii TaxID=303347 RepID=A0AAN6S6A4_9PEZI|nr:hypothetical protein QBC46DRAFT_448100 [Diplogelasinospora grovesii]